MGAAIGIETLKIFEKDWLLLSDFIDFFCGAQIGEGSSRTVFEFTLNKNLVVKIDRSFKGFNNINEWEIYNNIKNSHPKMASFLAPCTNISAGGKILLQAKTRPIKPKELPKLVPSFMADTKIQNWGKIGRRIVCHDYANHSFYHQKFTMKKTKWFSDGDLNAIAKRK